jgi:transposase-like protein
MERLLQEEMTEHLGYDKHSIEGNNRVSLHKRRKIT